MRTTLNIFCLLALTTTSAFAANCKKEQMRGLAKDAEWTLQVGAKFKVTDAEFERWDTLKPDQGNQSYSDPFFHKVEGGWTEVETIINGYDQVRYVISNKGSGAQYKTREFASAIETLIVRPLLIAGPGRTHQVVRISTGQEKGQSTVNVTNIENGTTRRHELPFRILNADVIDAKSGSPRLIVRGKAGTGLTFVRVYLISGELIELSSDMAPTYEGNKYRMVVDQDSRKVAFVPMGKVNIAGPVKVFNVSDEGVLSRDVFIDLTKAGEGTGVSVTGVTEGNVSNPTIPKFFSRTGTFQIPVDLKLSGNKNESGILEIYTKRK